MSETSKIDINSKDFRAPHGKKVNLSDWPTAVKPVYTSKDEYQELLEKHVAELSSLQHLHYASNRYPLLFHIDAVSLWLASRENM